MLAVLTQPIRGQSPPGMHQRLLKTFISVQRLLTFLLQRAVGKERVRGPWETLPVTPNSSRLHLADTSFLFYFNPTRGGF